MKNNRKEDLMRAKIVLLAGDGIGPEVVSAARMVMDEVGARFDLEFNMEERLVGGAAMDAVGHPLPEKTLRACQRADAILLGAVGGPKWDNPNADIRPEQGLLELRKGLGLFGNLRPVEPHPSLMGASPLRRELLHDVNLLVVRELTGGIYFGQPKKRHMDGGEPYAVDTMAYSEAEVRRIAHLAFRLAGEREGKVTSVDKANVLETSRLWRDVVSRVAESYPEVELETLLVDAATMHLLSRPSSFDVIVTANMFGDILTDEASVLAGSMGFLPSASVGEDRNQFGYPRGMYEPIHGSAPDIAGQGIANPIGAILSVAMLFRYSLGLEEAAQTVERAVNGALEAGYRTPDIANRGENTLGTDDMAEAVLSCC